MRFPWFGHFDSEYIGNTRCGNSPAGRPGFCYIRDRRCDINQLFVIYPPKDEQHLRGIIKSGTYTVEYCRHMLAHSCPVRTVTVERYLARKWEKSVFPIRNNFHDATIQFTAKKIDK